MNMDSIQIIKGNTLKQWLEADYYIKGIRANRGVTEYVVDVEDIDDDKYYHFYDKGHDYVVVEEAVIVKRAYEVDVTAR